MYKQDSSKPAQEEQASSANGESTKADSEDLANKNSKDEPVEGEVVN